MSAPDALQVSMWMEMGIVLPVMILSASNAMQMSVSIAQSDTHLWMENAKPASMITVHSV